MEGGEARKFPDQNGSPAFERWGDKVWTVTQTLWESTATANLISLCKVTQIHYYLREIKTKSQGSENALSSKLLA